MTIEGASPKAMPESGIGDKKPERDRLAHELFAVVRGLVVEIHPADTHPHISLGSSISRDLGIDSLALAELIVRLERRFEIQLPEDLLGRAETPADLLAAVEAFGEKPLRAMARRSDLPGLGDISGEPWEAKTLIEALDWHVARWPDRPHVLLSDGFTETETLTYGDLFSRAGSVASGLAGLIHEPGERVAIMLPTGAEFFEAFFGTLLAGGVPVPIYPPMRLSQIEDHLRRQAGILSNAEAAVLIAPRQGKAVAALLRAQVASLRALVAVDDLKAAGTSGPAARPEQPDLAMLQYTSGSTGAPKGVMLSHANLLANIRAMGQAIEASSKDVFVSWLPLYHDLGLIGAWFGSLYFAAPLVIMSPFTFIVRPEAWLWAIHRHKATLSAAPNFGFELCLKRFDPKALEGLDLSSLRFVANGAEPVSPLTLNRFIDRFAPYGFRPQSMAPVYGLAENAVGLAFPPINRLPKIDRVKRDALDRGVADEAPSGERQAVEHVSCGRPLPGHEIRTVDAIGRETGNRRVGRIEFKGPSATRGYFRNSEKTKALFDGDWLDTGDVGYLADGELFITGRIKDIIIKAGRNIFPEEIEEVVGDVQGVRKGCVAVFAATDAASGTEKLVILAEAHEMDEARLSALRSAITNAVADVLEAPPDDIAFVPPRTVPKTSSGKIRRAAARALYEEGELKEGTRPVWMQVARLSMAGLWTQVRGGGRLAVDILYAAWWWAIVVLAGALAWPLVVGLPAPGARFHALRLLARGAFALMGVRVSVAGDLPRGEEGSIIVSNHASYLDGLILTLAVPGTPVFVAKKELDGQLVAGPFLRRLRAFFAERGDPEAGLQETQALVAHARRGDVLIFFPEGTLTRMPGLLGFHLGAFSVAAEADVAVVPAVIRGSRAILRGGQWFPRRGHVSVSLGPAFKAEGPGFGAAVDLRNRARAWMLAASDEPDLAIERIVVGKDAEQEAR